MFFLFLLLSLFLLLCLCVPPASSHSLIVASHAIYALACLREDELLYLSGTGTAGKARGMVRFVPCEEIETCELWICMETAGTEIRTGHNSLI